jgi:phosphate transport system permease protein
MTATLPPRIHLGARAGDERSTDVIARQRERELRAARADLPETRRELSARTLDDGAALLGAGVGSGAFVWVVYLGLMPFSGALGFVVLWYVCFLLLYATVTALGNPGPVVADRISAAVVVGGAATVGLGLLSVVAVTFYRGRESLSQFQMLVNDGSVVGPRTELTLGGFGHALIGSLIQIGIAVAIALPLGVGCAVFMTEVGGRFARLVRTVVEAMTALPSIVAGLFIYTTWLVALGNERSGFAAALALSVMMLPIIARAAEVVLRVVPGGLREASLALGASQWQTVWRVVLPTARPGLATALILGVARGVGETSPVLLTSGASQFLNVNPFSGGMNSLPLYTYTFARSGEPLLIARAFGAATVLLVLVLALFVIARSLAKQRTGRR